MPPFGRGFWHDRAFMLVAGSALVFGLCTMAAMLAYPGGTMNDPTTVGYLFGRNFFSDLGIWTAHNGTPNTTSFALFFSALTLVGLSQVLFFAAFQRQFTASETMRRIATAGSLLGAVAGLCLVGVAMTPADLFLSTHIAFTKWAFRLFPLATLLYAVVMFRSEDFPDRFAWVFAGFAALLVAYLLLLEFGPSPKTDAGLTIQVAGQKAIVFASILSVMVVAIGARGVARSRAGAESNSG